MNAYETTTPDEQNDADENDPGAGSGEGGSLGTPGGLPDTEPPSAEQDDDYVVSGGGVAHPSKEDGEDA